MLKEKQIIIKGELIDGYIINTKGEVFSEKRNLYIRPRLHTGGYLQVTLWNSKQYDAYVHRLVATAFIKNPLNKKCVNHKDGDKHNNNVENLEWATDAENQKHSYANGLNSRNGKNNGQSKLTEKIVKYIRKIYKKNPLTSSKELANKYGVSTGSIRCVVTRKTWGHVK